MYIGRNGISSIYHLNYNEEAMKIKQMNHKQRKNTQYVQQGIIIHPYRKLIFCVSIWVIMVSELRRFLLYIFKKNGEKINEL